jgi:hypothetical protein
VMAWTRKKEPVEAWSRGRKAFPSWYGEQLFAGSSPAASILSGV